MKLDFPILLYEDTGYPTYRRLIMLVGYVNYIRFYLPTSQAAFNSLAPEDAQQLKKYDFHFKFIIHSSSLGTPREKIAL